MTVIWRSFIIVLALLLHLLLAGPARADNMQFSRDGHVALSKEIGISGRTAYLGHAGNQYMDSEMQLEISPRSAGGFYAGYRMVDLKMQRSGPLLNTAVSGPYIGGFIRF